MSEARLRAIVWCAVSTKSQTEDEKISLPAQEADARALCDRENWRVVEVLRVPGHSRRYVDIHECAADMRNQGIDAFDRLLSHWQAQDFDVLIVRDGDRFARTQTLHAYVTEMTIDIGSRIYSLSDGWIDDKNYRMWIAMSGYKAASNVDFLVNAYKNAMDKRVHEGLPMGSRVPFSHEVIRDEAGHAVGMRVKEHLRRLWDDMAEVFLRGVAWQMIGETLRDEFGHVHPDTGKTLSRMFVHNLYHRPTFWGNNARHYAGKLVDDMAWVYDPSVPSPEGATIVYGTHEPVYTGELAQRVQAEMKRRANTKGKMSPAHSYKFSALLQCAECGVQLAATRNQYGRVYYRCGTHWRLDDDRTCESRTRIPEVDVISWLDVRLRKLVQLGDLLPLEAPPVDNGETPLDEQITELEIEIAGLEDALKRLLLRQAQTDDPPLADAFNSTIYDTSERIKTMRAHLLGLRQRQPSRVAIEDARRASDEISALSIDAFWQLEDREINQLLQRLLGDVRLVVDTDGVAGLINRRTMGQ